MRKKIKEIDDHIESGFRRIAAIIGGIIFCLTLTIVLVIYTPLAGPNFSLQGLFLFCLPSLIIGTLLGCYFPKTFGIIATILACVGFDV